MNATRLLEHFDRISDAADAVPRLRRLVFDLAVRGRLLPVASVWSEMTIGELGAWGSGGTPLKTHAEYYGGDIPWLVIGDLNDGVVTSATTHITQAGLDNSSAKLIDPGAVLIALYGSIGKLGVTGIRCATNQAMAHCVPDEKIVSRDYLFLLLRSMRDSLLARGQGVAQQNISQKILKAERVKVPPLAEQQRIVAKVDELMALCDRLEAAQVEREARRDRLVSASLARVTRPAADDAASDARAAGFHLDHFARLTTRPEHVKQLRQTILNLAVRGRLGPQDPRDQAGHSLRESIATAKADLRQSTNDHRIKASPPPKTALPFDIPPTWTAESFENLFLFIDYRGKTPPKTTAGVPLITAKNIRMGFLNREPREFISQQTFSGWMTRGFPRIGDLFFTTEAPLANLCLNNINEPFGLAQRVVCLQPYGDSDTKFFMYAVMSPLMQSLIDAHASGTTARGIKTAKLKPLPIPLPPLAEQRRIVAKVDELMALCDQLEASLAAAATDRARLLESLLHEALAPAAA